MADLHARRRTAFAGVADEYDRGRPGYPPAVLDALGDLAGRRVLDVGAGTGIATRLLLARGALVVAVDPSPEMLGRARAQTPQLRAVVGDGARLPVPDAAADVVTFAQSWHWLDPERRIDEVHRVLRPGGRWAAWWTHARGADWVERSWDLIEAACPGVVRTQRDTDWGADVAASGRFAVGDRITVAWDRTIGVGDELVNTASHSYVAALAPEPRAALLADLHALYDATFPDGTMTIPLETWLWIGRRRPTVGAMSPARHRRLPWVGPTERSEP